MAMKQLKEIVDIRSNVHRSVESQYPADIMNNSTHFHNPRSGSHGLQNSNYLNKSALLHQNSSLLNKSTMNSSGYFGTAPRFPPSKHYQGSYYDLKSELSKVSKSFSRAERPGIYNHHQLKNPAPNQYSYTDLNESIQLNGGKSRGKTFGASYECYRKVCVPDVNQQSPAPNDYPGPGTYLQRKNPGAGRRSSSFQSGTIRFKTPRDSKKEEGQRDRGLAKRTPPPNAYIPKQAQGRFSNIGFGFGDRQFIKQSTRHDAPGPGHYVIKTKFDKIVENAQRSRSTHSIRHRRDQQSSKANPSFKNVVYHN